MHLECGQRTRIHLTRRCHLSSLRHLSLLLSPNRTTSPKRRLCLGLLPTSASNLGQNDMPPYRNSDGESFGGLATWPQTNSAWDSGTSMHFLGGGSLFVLAHHLPPPSSSVLSCDRNELDKHKSVWMDVSRQPNVAAPLGPKSNGHNKLGKGNELFAFCLDAF